MNKDTTIRQLKQWDKQYHTLGKTSVSDTQYDRLKTEAKTLWPDHPYFQTVGSSTAGEKVKLPYVLGSLDKVKVDTVKAWLDSHKGPFQVMSKLDGISFYIEYNNGVVVRGATRGDGSYGQDISDKLKVICPEINTNDKIIFRGELVLKKDVDITKLGYKNRRNGVVGITNRKGLEHVELISPVFYEVIVRNGKSITAYEADKILQTIGLSTPKSRVFENAGNMSEFLVDKLVEWKTDEEYDIDGLVIVVYNSLRENIMIPENKVAFKCNTEAIEAKVVSVEWNTSRLGRVIPTVLLEPIDIGGVTISKATGFNALFIKENKIQQDTIVTIIRAGEVIPHIVDILS